MKSSPAPPTPCAAVRRGVGTGGPGHYSEVLKNIDAILFEKGKRRAYLGKALGKSRGWISQVMSGKIMLGIDTLLDIARVLGVEPSSLIPPPREGGAAYKPSLEEYVRGIVRDEIVRQVEAAKKDSGEADG